MRGVWCGREGHCEAHGETKWDYIEYAYPFQSGDLNVICMLIRLRVAFVCVCVCSVTVVIDASISVFDSFYIFFLGM